MSGHIGRSNAERHLAGGPVDVQCSFHRDRWKGRIVAVVRNGRWIRRRAARRRQAVRTGVSYPVRAAVGVHRGAGGIGAWQLGTISAFPFARGRKTECRKPSTPFFRTLRRSVSFSSMSESKGGPGLIASLRSEVPGSRSHLDGRRSITATTPAQRPYSSDKGPTVVVRASPALTPPSPSTSPWPVRAWPAWCHFRMRPPTAFCAVTLLTRMRRCGGRPRRAAILRYVARQ